MNTEKQWSVNALGGGRRIASPPWPFRLRRVELGAVLAAGLSLAIALSGGSAQAQIKPKDAIMANRYSLTIDGAEIAAFQELSGLVSEVEVQEYGEVGDEGPIFDRLSVKLKPPTITLKRGMNGSLELWAWHEAVRTGNMAVARKSASLIMFNSEGRPVAKYWLENAWPSKLDVAGLKAGASEALIETVTLHCESIQRVSP